MKKLREIISGQSSLVFADQLIFSGSNFLLTFLLARKLNISDFGYFSGILLSTYLLVGISNSILVQPFQIMSAKNFDKKALGFVFQASLLLMLIFVGVLFLIRFLPFPALIIFRTNLLAVIIFIIGYILQDFLRKILLTLGHLKLVIFIDCLFTVIFPLLFFQKDLSLAGVLFSIGIVNLIASVPGIFYVLKNASFSLQNRIYINYHIKEGKWLLSASVVQWFSNNFFTLIAGVYLGMNALGALRLVQSFFGIINIALQTVENYFLPKLAQLHYQNRPVEKQDLLKILNRGMFLLGGIIVIIFIFSQYFIVLIGGEKYEAYGFVIRLISVLYIIIICGYSTRISIRVLEQNKAFFVGYCISFVFSLLTFHFLLKYFGLYGAVSGLVMNQILMIIYWKILLNKKNISVWA